MGRIILILIITLNLYAKEGLTFGFMPYLSPMTIHKKYTPLVKYLSKKISKDIKIVVSKDYDTYIQNIKKGDVDIAFLGGSTYIELENIIKSENLLIRYEIDHKDYFKSVLFSTKKIDLNKIDTKNYKIALGSEKSTLSSIMPKYILLEKGLDKNKFEHKHLSSHDNVIFGVLSGEFDMGGVAYEVFSEAKKKYNLKKVAESPKVSTHLLAVTSSHISKEEKNILKKSLLSLKDEKPDILRSISHNLTSFIEVKPKCYNNLKKYIKTTRKHYDKGQ